MELSKKDRSDFIQGVCDYLSQKDGCKTVPYSSARALQVSYKGYFYKIKLVIDRNRIELNNVVNGSYTEHAIVKFDSPTKFEEIFKFLELVHTNTVLKFKETEWYR